LYLEKVGVAVIFSSLLLSVTSSVLHVYLFLHLE